MALGGKIVQLVEFSTKKIARICIKLYNFVENSTKNLLQPGVASERVGERSIGYKAQ